MQGPVGAEHHFQQNFAFQLQFARFVGIDRLRLERNLHRSSRRSQIGLRDLRPGMNHLLRSESARRYTAATPTTAPVSLASGRDAVAEVGAGHRDRKSAW